MTQFTSGSYNLHGVASVYLPCPFLPGTQRRVRRLLIVLPRAAGRCPAGPGHETRPGRVTQTMTTTGSRGTA